VQGGATLERPHVCRGRAKGAWGYDSFSANEGFFGYKSECAA